MALFLCRRGYSLLPLEPAGKKRMNRLLPKDPRTGKPSWLLLAGDRPATELEIRKWFDECPDINIGMICGQASGVSVVDVDKPHLLPEDLDLPDTLRVNTYRGYHLYYRTRGPVKDRKYPWGELKADGGIVVLPPSIHPDGGRYTLEDPGQDFDDAISPAPTWVEPDAHPTGGLASDADPLTPQPHNDQDHRTTGSDKEGPTASCITGLLEADDRWMAKTPGGRWMEAHQAVPAVAIRVINDLCGGQAKELDRAFLCPLHPEENPSAALRQSDPGRPIALRDFHEATRAAQVSGLTDDKGYIKWWPLPDCYAAVTTGQLRLLKSGERMIWWIRALHQLGYIELAEDVHARPLPVPDGSTYIFKRADGKKVSYHAVSQESVAAVYEGFQYLLQLRSRYDPNQKGSPFAHRFAAGWCGLSVTTVGKAMRYLMQNGFIRVLEVRSPKANLLDMGRRQRERGEGR